MRGTHVIPMLVAAGFSYQQQETIAQTIRKPLDLVLVAVTQYELSSIAKQLSMEEIFDEFDGVEGDFSEYIRDNFDSEFRDPAIDYWDNPYVIEDQGDEWLVYSFGPDGWDDTEDDIWVYVEKR